MNIFEIVKASKSNVNWGDWTDKKPKKADFPMSKKRGNIFPITRKWRWVTIDFDALGRKFVVFVTYHKDVPEFQAVLAERLPQDTRTLSRLEYHGRHPVLGWHVHACCGDVSELELGITKPKGQKRIPSAHNFHRQAEFTSGEDSMSDTLAFKIAAKRYGLPYNKDLLGNIVR